MIPARRNALIALVALAAWPLLARTQTPAQMRRIAWLGLERPDAPSPYFDALRAALRDLGWSEGRNLAIKQYWNEGTIADAERMVPEIIASKPEVIITQEFNTFAAHRSQLAIPIVFGFSGDPVDAGLVQSFAHPGGNLTGISYLALDLVGKRIELLKEAVPQIRRIAILARPQHPGEQRERLASEEAVRKLGLTLVYFPVRDLGELENTFRAIAQHRCDALVVFPDSIMSANRERIVRFAVKAKMPAVSGWAAFAESGLLLSYGPNLRDLYRALARYVDRILRGAKPGELPVELPRSVEFVVNTRTARALGIKIPNSILLRADKVIE